MGSVCQVQEVLTQGWQKQTLSLLYQVLPGSSHQEEERDRCGGGKHLLSQQGRPWGAPRAAAGVLAIQHLVIPSRTGGHLLMLLVYLW